MTFTTKVGRVHKISSEANEIASRICKEIPQDQLYKRKGVQRPTWMNLQFYNTEQERMYLANVAEEHNSKTRKSNRLITHGTQDSGHLCQILIDGMLQHIKGIENYGDLGAYQKTTQAGGYWDNGWGIFIATPKTIAECLAQSQEKPFLEVPISELEAVVLPTQIVPAVQKEFPPYAQLFRGYAQFAEEIKQKPTDKGIAMKVIKLYRRMRNK